MPIKDLLRPSELAALRRLRKRIMKRTAMRRYRSDPLYYKRLCAGVDLPLESGTCGRLVNRSSGERCYRCWQRRQWLLNHAMTPYEIALAGMLADDLERDVNRRRARRRPAHRRHRSPAGRCRRHARTRRPLPALVGASEHPGRNRLRRRGRRRFRCLARPAPRRPSARR